MKNSFNSKDSKQLKEFKNVKDILRYHKSKMIKILFKTHCRYSLKDIAFMFELSLALLDKSYNNSYLSFSSIIVFLPFALWESSDFFSSLFELLSLDLGSLSHVSIDVQKSIFNCNSEILLQSTPNYTENCVRSWNNFNSCLGVIAGMFLNPSHARLAHFGLCNCSWNVSSFGKQILSYLAECEQSRRSNTEIHRTL